MRLMDELHLIPPVLPELEEMKGLPQGPPAAPTGDLWEHVLKVLDMLEGPTWPAPQPVSFPLAFAALLHDVGKRRTMGRTPEKYTFHGHEHLGRRMAAEIGVRLKLANVEKARIEWLVDKHQYLCEAPGMRASRLKTILVHPGIGELLALHRADSLASGRSIAHLEFCERILRETAPEELNPPPVITGDDLAALGIEPGPVYKKLLDSAREAQLEGTVRTKDEAMEMVKRLAADDGV
jgi:poly(A) polymerase